MTAFPGSTPSFAGFTSSHTLAADSHAAQHNLEQSEIVALANKLGTGASTPVSSRLLRGNGAGTSAWAQADLTSDVTGVLPQANGGTGTTLATGTGKAVYDTSPTLSSPTLTTPTISSFTNANHDHSNSANGGSLGAVTATSLTTNTIAANGANHLSLSAGTNKLVKSTVLRQDDTVNTYQVGNSVILTGWGVIAYNTGAQTVSEAVSLGLTFSALPIVLIAFGGDHAGSTTYGLGGNNVEGKLFIKAHSITTTGFTAQIHTGAGVNFAAGNGFYQWIAVGEIA